MRYIFIEKDEEKNIIVCGYVDLRTWSATQGSWSISKRIDHNDPSLFRLTGYDFKWDVDVRKKWKINHIYPIQKEYYYEMFQEIFG